MSANPSSGWWRWRTPAAPIPSPRRPRLSVFLAVPALASCTLWPWTHSTERFAALPPATYGGTARAEQILKLSAGDSTRTLQTYVEVTPERISMVGATALGQRVLSFTSDAEGLHVEAAPSGPAEPEQMLADLELATWPLAALQAATAGGVWHIAELPGLRRVLRGTEPYAEIHYGGVAPPWNGHMLLVNFPYRYTLDIESRPLE